MITTGLSLAIVTSIGFFMLYKKLPRKVKRFMRKHTLLTDTIACLLTFSLFGGTIVALFASGFLGVITTCLLAIANNPELCALFDEVAKGAAKLKEGFLNWVASFHTTPVSQPELKVM